MNGYNFTERVRKVLQNARQEALGLNHEYVATEHILLGLVADGGGVACTALQNLGVEAEPVRQQVLNTVTPGADVASRGPDLPYTSRAKKVLELAMQAARNLDHAYVGTEHLLLGLMREQQGVGAQVLASFGLTAAKLEDEIVRLLHGEHPEQRDDAMPGKPAPQAERRVAERQAEITVVVEHPDGRVEAKKFRHRNDAMTFLGGLEY